MELLKTEEGTFNFWALEVTDLKENFFCSIPGALCVQRMRVYRIIRLQSLLPLCPQRLSLSSELWITALREHFRINREQYKKKSPESWWKRTRSLWFSKIKYGKRARVLYSTILQKCSQIDWTLISFLLEVKHPRPFWDNETQLWSSIS